jgi:flagellar basal-body rod modification protein FlgD
MTAIPPASIYSTPSTASTSATGDTNQLNQDTFLKLLVAQMKYQDPLSPTDSTAFLTQTAQFTQVSTLQQIMKDQQSMGHTNELLAASGMVGSGVSYSTTGIAASTAVATTSVSVGGNLAQDAPVGAKSTIDSSIYTNVGKKIPLQLQFTRTADGWSVQASSGGASIGPAQAITFDGSGQRTSADFTLSQSDLDQLDGSTGTWPTAGVTIAMGGANDPNRLEMGSGASKTAVLEQNGGDGSSLSGVVTGIKITADGPTLTIGGRDVPLASVMEVQAPAL